MATDFSKLKDLNLSQEEIGSFSKAFKDEEFRKLFREYAEEISDPVNRQKYEEELAQMERDRGMDVQFIHPTPGYVMKTSIDGEKKAFINICTSDLVGKPSSSPGTDKSKPGGMKSGVQWSIPYSLAPPREDLDKTGNRCMVYDCVFHPDTLQIAERNQRFRTMINDTAMDGIETNFKVKLDRTNLRCPKMQYKGKPTASVIRTPRKEGATGVEDGFKSFDVPYPYNEPSREDMPPKSNTTISGNRKGANESNASAPTVPKHTIVHRGHFDIQNFRDAPDAAPTTRPQELVITVQLPLLKSAKTLNLDIYERQLCLESSKPAAYKLDIKLPYPVDENRGSAKFDKSKRCLTVTIPVLAPKIPDLPSFVEGHEKQLVEELHDEEKNTQETVAEKKEEEVVVKEEAKLDDTEMDLMVADAVERETEKNENIQQVPALTKNTDKKSETIDTSVQQVESGSIDSDELSEKEEFQHEAETNNMATVLEPPVYLMPDYSYRQDSETITFVLHVPCVKADSVKKQLVCGLSGLHVTMETKPENNNQEVRNYSFYAQFLPSFSISPDIICDIFNDKIILLLKKMTEKGSWKTFRVGKDEHCLKVCSSSSFCLYKM
ncbi:protein kintoun-like [Saccoglossus kowalevskii]|uniref:Protein kintoun n=1 Tax=Saccoglossus kowalevskii TaxID=10224 RepID=A0ABM0H0Z6_SACKO|nr:PREDICTED: protein kintoun-like [Saccoglossus kowalevskii]